MKKESQKSSEELLSEEKVSQETAEEVKVEKKIPEAKVGAQLKSARLKEGKKVSDIAQKLCIRKVYLEAIEASDYANIPEYPYGPGFIRSYAEYLGLDGEELVSRFKVENDTFAGRNQPIYVPEPHVEATVPSPKYLLISLLAIAAVYGGWHFYNNYQPAPMPEKTAEPMQEVSQEEDFPLVVEDFAQVDENASAAPQEAEPLKVIDTTAAPQTSDTPQVTVTEESFSEDKIQKEEKKEPASEAKAKSETKPEAKAKPEAKGKSSLVLKFNTDTWVEVKNDEIVYISKVLKAGEEYAVPQDKDLKLSTGNAGGFDVYVAGVKQEAVGAPGTVKKNISVDSLISKANH